MQKSQCFIPAIISSTTVLLTYVGVGVLNPSIFLIGENCLRKTFEKSNS